MTKYAVSEKQKKLNRSDEKTEHMEKAMEEYRDEQKKEKKDQISIRALAAKHNIAYSTLLDRVNGKQSIQAFNATKQRLTTAEEEILVKLISVFSNQGIPFQHATIAEHANRIIQARTDENEQFEPVGTRWVFNFLVRHRQVLKTYWSKGLDTKRAQALNPTAVKDWFNIVRNEIVDKGILPENIYAIDESGFPPSGQGTMRVVGTIGKKRQYKQGNASRENVTVLVTICADGSTLTPLIVYKAHSLQSRWTKENIANARYVL